MTTTIKVSEETRDLLKRQASRAELTLGGYLERLAKRAERLERLEELRAAIEATPSEKLASYRAETEEWESVDGGR